jgi:hypothetical protein
MRFTLQVRLNPIGTDLSSGAVLTWIRVRDHPGIILDMFLNPIAAGLDTTLTRTSQELQPRITSTELKASRLKARRFESQRVLLIYLPIENVRHSDVRFRWELVGSPFHCISAHANIPRISASQLKISKILASHSRSASTFAFA